MKIVNHTRFDTDFLEKQLAWCFAETGVREEQMEEASFYDSLDNETERGQAAPGSIKVWIGPDNARRGGGHYYGEEVPALLDAIESLAFLISHELLHQKYFATGSDLSKGDIERRIVKETREILQRFRGMRADVEAGGKASFHAIAVVRLNAVIRGDKSPEAQAALREALRQLGPEVRAMLVARLSPPKLPPPPFARAQIRRRVALPV
jgi:hypothetical protein